MLSTESTRLLAYGERDELLLSTAGQLLAQAIARHREDEPATVVRPGPRTVHSAADTLQVRYYEVDDSLFINDANLIKGLPRVLRAKFDRPASPRGHASVTECCWRLGVWQRRDLETRGKTKPA